MKSEPSRVAVSLDLHSEVLACMSSPLEQLTALTLALQGQGRGMARPAHTRRLGRLCTLDSSRSWTPRESLGP